MSEVVAAGAWRFGRVRPWLLAPLAIFLALAAVFAMRIGDDPSLVPSPLIGKEAPPLALTGISGLERDGHPVEGVADADLRGGAVLLNVFASWCVPCREEQPVLMRLAGEGKAKVFGLDYKDRPENARRFLGALGNPYAKVGADLTGRAALDFGVYGVPETFAIDASGRIVGKHVGALTLAAARDLLRKAGIGGGP